jgi:dCMP deaminase
MADEQIIKPKMKTAYMDVAERFAELSSAKRLHVGAIVVKDDRIISIGYNGMPTGWDNNCEYREYDLATDINGNYFPDPDGHYPYADEHGRYALRTRPEVLHAEMNSLMKLAKSNESADGAAIFITHAPCMECAKGIYQAGIKEVYYKNDYRSSQGLDFLKQCGVKVTKV